MTALWHYTCHHGWAALGNVGELVPARNLTDRIPPGWWPGDFVWTTDLAAPIRDALGLTMELAACDRTRHRYRVTDPATCTPWVDVRHVFPDAHLLENAPGARPRHWWVSPLPVPAVYDPRP